jgi:hypothetical protein
MGPRCRRGPGWPAAPFTWGSGRHVVGCGGRREGRAQRGSAAGRCDHGGCDTVGQRADSLFGCLGIISGSTPKVEELHQANMPSRPCHRWGRQRSGGGGGGGGGGRARAGGTRRRQSGPCGGGGRRRAPRRPGGGIRSGLCVRVCVCACVCEGVCVCCPTSVRVDRGGCRVRVGGRRAWRRREVSRHARAPQTDTAPHTATVQTLCAAHGHCADTVHRTRPRTGGGVVEEPAPDRRRFDLRRPSRSGPSAGRYGRGGEEGTASVDGYRGAESVEGEMQR